MILKKYIQLYKIFSQSDMEAHIELNGSYTQKGNYLWGGALTLAWKQLSQDIIKEQIKIKTNDHKLLKIAQNFNKSPFNFNMLTESCYYARAGFGNQTVHKINEQVSKKFPGKTTGKIQPNLNPDSIISYAYFLKLMKFHSPFKRCQVQFNKKTIQGFEAKDPAQKKQVLVHKYSNNNNFMIQLMTKAQNDHIIIIKSQQKQTPEQILEKVNKLTSGGKPIGKSDTFKMPKISLSRKRDLNQLVGIFLQNEKFKQYSFTQIYEIMKLDIDETGVKVQNQGVIIMDRCAVIQKEQPRRFELDQPFWIVMREKLNHPYFVAYIANVDDKDN